VLYLHGARIIIIQLEPRLSFPLKERILTAHAETIRSSADPTRAAAKPVPPIPPVKPDAQPVKKLKKVVARRAGK
jgi:hypothetical protein